ncbi:MAG TPA: hypothetical protein VKP11_08595, partial [Frankiaceae bacterium]|nr:hypothetical protein [Frankiaceae bacterium]
ARMSGSSRAALACLAIVAAGGASAPRAAAFVDPLDLPAAPSVRAPRSAVAAVARAGARLVAVGQRGHVLLSDDGGASWTQASVPVSTDLTAVHFPTPSTGFAVGHDGVVLSTADGGLTWTRRLDGRALAPLLRARCGGGGVAAEQACALAARAPDAAFLDVWFEDASSGFAVGAFNLVVRTEDGGASWTPWLDRVENPRGLHLYAVRGAGGAVLLAGEQGLLLRLDPGARRFRAIPAPRGGTLFGLVATADAVVAFGLGGRALRSGDGGASWREVATGVDASLTGGTVLPDGRIALASQSGRVLVSGGGGGSFRPIGSGSPGRVPPAAAIAAAEPDAVVLGGPAGLRRERL